MNREDIIHYWLEKAQEDLASARANFEEERYQNAVRDAYFACFHAFSALLHKDGKHFKKHREVRAILHRDYIRANILDAAWGRHYDWLFDNRQKADYRPLITYAREQMGEIVTDSKNFVDQMTLLIKHRPNDVTGIKTNES